VSDQQRDWDKELAEIDRLIAGQKSAPEPKGVAPAAKGAAPAPAAQRAPAPGPVRVGRKELIGAWSKVGLGVVLAAAMSQWPYQHACGGGLFTYLGASGAVVVAGLWASIGTWRRRLGVAHAMGLLVVGWGLGLLALQILPRIGYARETLTWWCP